MARYALKRFDKIGEGTSKIALLIPGGMFTNIQKIRFMLHTFSKIKNSIDYVEVETGQLQDAISSNNGDIVLLLTS